MPRNWEVVYRYCGEHHHVEKGRRFADGHVVITAPDYLAEAHRENQTEAPE